MALEPNTGEVKSYLGGIDYTYFKYDHVSQSKRQVDLYLNRLYILQLSKMA